jgi:hypothetical protein
VNKKDRRREGEKQGRKTKGGRMGGNNGRMEKQMKEWRKG